MNHLPALIKKIETYIPYHEQNNPNVSTSPVGWHLQHILLTISLIIENVKKSDPTLYKWKFSFIKMIVFTTKKIPRGKAKAPDLVVPKQVATEASIKEELNKAARAIKALDAIPANHYFKHPFFGNLKVKPTIKFLAIHTNHHLAIITDIIKNGQ